MDGTGQCPLFPLGEGPGVRGFRWDRYPACPGLLSARRMAGAVELERGDVLVGGVAQVGGGANVLVEEVARQVHLFASGVDRHNQPIKYADVFCFGIIFNLGVVAHASVGA